MCIRLSWMLKSTGATRPVCAHKRTAQLLAAMPAL